MEGRREPGCRRGADGEVQVLSAERQAVRILGQPGDEPRELIYLRFPLLDGEDNEPALLIQAMQTVARLLQARIPTLVCCGGGLSRSPAIVAAALALADTDGKELDAWLEKMAHLGPLDV